VGQDGGVGANLQLGNFVEDVSHGGFLVFYVA
jgi:hypothetical protein